MGIPGSANPLLLVSAAAAPAAGYTIERSLRFNSGDSAYLNRTPEAAGNRKTWTWSGWVKRGSLSSVQRIFTAYEAGNSAYNYIQWNSDDKIRIYGGSAAATNIIDLQTNAVFRDASAWYHVVVAFDTTQSTSSDRVKVYINGVQQTFSTATYPAQNVDYYINSTFEHRIGDLSGSDYLNGYLADVHFIDGQALAATDFGELDANNVWQPKEFVSPSPNNGTTWSATTNGNFNTSISRGADKAFNGNVGGTDYAHANTGTTATVSSLGITGITSIRVNIAKNNTGDNWGTFALDSTDLTSWLQTNYPSVGNSGTWIDVTSQFASSTLGSISITTNSDGVTDVRLAGVEINGYVLIDGETAYGRNGFHLPFSDNSSTIALGTDTSVTVSAAEANKGMDVVTYTGNGGTQTINGLRFAPDFVWIKNRTGYDHVLFDTVRGSNGGYFLPLTSNATNAENTYGNGAYGCITSFNNDGFSLGSSNSDYRHTNQSSNGYVAWCWKAGGPAVTNTNGSITSQVSANNDYGFSVVAWNSTSGTAHTFGHGLSSAPKFVIVKKRSTGNWRVGHDSLGWSTALELNTTGAAFSSDGAYWNNTAPTSSVISIGDTGQLGGDNIAYCWSEVSGFSKFGSYTGNGVDGAGPTITTGFKPRWVLIKGADASNDNWKIYDTARSGLTNPVDDWLAPNNSNAETANNNNKIDVLDNGFQIKTTGGGDTNYNNYEYIYAAFASEPGNNWALNNFVANSTSTGFKAVTYSGTGSSQTISVPFEADLIWTKTRTNAINHKLTDSVRGFTKVLGSDTTAAEETVTTGITAVNSTGFTVGTSTDYNVSGRTYVAWCWDAGSSTVSNTDGTITSSVRANTSTGFSIVTYGTSGSAGTIGHGLGSSPAFIITKQRNGTTAWYSYHQSLGATKYVLLNSNGAAGTASSIWNDTAPTSSVFSVGSGFGSGETYVAYCFAPKPGVSAFGSYTGTGSAGLSVTTGFRPAFVMIKRTDSSGEWTIFDSARDNVNPITLQLYASSSQSEVNGSTDIIDWQPNGFSLAYSGGALNQSGGTYIYMAFASAEDGAEVDSLLDSATNANADSDTGAGGEVSGNYATLNPLAITSGANSPTNGNLDWSRGGSQSYGGLATIAPSTGKWYWECTVTTVGDTNYGVGVLYSGAPASQRDGQAGASYGALYQAVGRVIKNGSIIGGTYASYTTGDVIGVAYDADALSVTFYKNNTAQPAVSLSSPTSAYAPWIFLYVSTAAVTCNFGQRPFAYTAPTGYQPLTTALLDDPTIADGSTAMDVALYTGTGSSQSISGLGFSPDLVWLKSRTNGSTWFFHFLFDTIRGVNAGLASNSTQAELDPSTYPNLLTAFNSDGFTVGSDFSQSTRPYVAWTWDGGSSTVSNTDGSITSSVRANASAGFSIVTASASSAGDTIGHGLNVAPSLIVAKRTGITSHWPIYHSSVGANGFLYLNLTNAAGTGADFWNNSAPTSTVFTVGSDLGVTGGTAVFYCWAPVEGYSAFGSYNGNGSSDGPFVYTGFRPKYLLWKVTQNNSNYAGWYTLDTSTSPYNEAKNRLHPNASSAEATMSNGIDFLSNGFKLRSSDTDLNGAYTYIYAAFAEHPFKTSRAR